MGANSIMPETWQIAGSARTFGRALDDRIAVKSPTLPSPDRPSMACSDGFV
jgi:hypothetical protein